MFNVCFALDEGGSNHVNVPLGTENLDVLSVLFGEDGKVNDNTGQVHVLLLTDVSFVHDFNHNRFLFELLNFAGKGTISNEDGLANLDAGGETRVGAGDLRVVTLEGKVVFGGDLKILAHFEIDVLTVLEVTSADLGSLGVEHESNALVWALSQSQLKLLDHLTVGLVVTMGEVKTSNVKASIDHREELIFSAAGRTKGADNLGVALGDIDISLHVGEGEEGGDVQNLLFGGFFKVFNLLCECCILSCEVSVLLLVLLVVSLYLGGLYLLFFGLVKHVAHAESGDGTDTEADKHILLVVIHIF